MNIIQELQHLLVVIYLLQSILFSERLICRQPEIYKPVSNVVRTWYTFVQE